MKRRIPFLHRIAVLVAISYLSLTAALFALGTHWLLAMLGVLSLTTALGAGALTLAAARRSIAWHGRREATRLDSLAGQVRQLQASLAKANWRVESQLQQIRSQTRRTVDALVGSSALAVEPTGRKVLFVTSNGTGLGHVARSLAIADQGRASGAFESAILSLSFAAHELPPTLGVSYFPSRREEESWYRWNLDFQLHLRRMFAREEYAAVVFDGPSLFPGLQAAVLTSNIPIVWVCRGLWKNGISTDEARLAAEVCALVVTPDEAELAPWDTVVPHGLSSRRVPAVVRVDPSSAPTREQAREQLGIAEDERAVLLTLGAATSRGQADIPQHIVEAMSSLGKEWVPYFLLSPLDDPTSVPVGARVVRGFPIAHLLRAFDLVVGAAGYNTVHEARVMGVRALLVPNPRSQTDDQQRRANLAEKAGIAIASNGDFRNELVRAVALSPFKPRDVSDDGAAEIAGAIYEVIKRRTLTRRMDENDVEQASEELG